MTTDTIEELTLALRAFAQERDWEKFHTPKNLAMAVMVEAAEIAEHFQWSGCGDPDVDAMPEEKREKIALEIADTLLYLLRLADVLGVDPVATAARKMKINASRYPVEKAFSRALKHDQL
jgi:NTP pyrophosphatase (non-canonical NTP hydrolase)